MFTVSIQIKVSIYNILRASRKLLPSPPTRSSRQDLVNTASSDNTYSGSQDLNLASKTTTQAGEKGTTEDLKATIAKTAKSHKWGEHAVAILTAIVLAGAATLAALRNFLMSKKVDK